MQVKNSMPRKSTLQPRSGCPISLALELLGDPWSLLIVRDLMFKGVGTFNGFLHAGEGIASNILSNRLSRPEAAGILTRRRDDKDVRRVCYRLTAKGMDLAPVLVDLVVWSAKHEDTDAPAVTVRRMRLHRERFLTEVREAWSKDEK